LPNARRSGFGAAHPSFTGAPAPNRCTHVGACRARLSSAQLPRGGPSLFTLRARGSPPQRRRADGRGREARGYWHKKGEAEEESGTGWRGKRRQGGRERTRRQESSTATLADSTLNVVIGPCSTGGPTNSCSFWRAPAGVAGRVPALLGTNSDIYSGQGAPSLQKTAARNAMSAARLSILGHCPAARFPCSWTAVQTQGDATPPKLPMTRATIGSATTVSTHSPTSPPFAASGEKTCVFRSTTGRDSMSSAGLLR